MAGICAHCGEVTEQLQSCELCGAQVCPDCKKPSGCESCGGMRTVE